MDIYEYIVLGGGPAGIQMAYFLEKNQSSYLLLEHGSHSGTFFKKFPKHRTLISVNKSYCTHSKIQPTIENTLRYDWNSLLQDIDEDDYLLFSKYTDSYYPSADLLVTYLNDFINKYNLNIQTNTTIIHVNKHHNLYEIHCIYDNKPITYLCEKLLIATGLQPKTITIKNNHPNILYYESMPVHKDFYKHKNILILGGGNAAFETANFINDVANEIILCGGEKFAWNTHYPGNIRSINMKILDSYYLKLKVNLDWTNTKYLRYDDKLNYYINLIEQNLIWNFPIDYVIVCLGFKPALDYLNTESIPLTLSKQGFPILTPFYESVSCKNIYFLGALSQEHDYKHGTSAFIHGFRYNARVLSHYLKNTFNMKQFLNLVDLNHYLIEEINTSSQLLHRFDFHGHIILMHQNSVNVLHDMPLELLSNIHLLVSLFHINIDQLQSSIIATIYLGYDKRNPFYSTFRQPQTGNPKYMDNSVFIHPILKYYKYDSIQTKLQCVHEVHLPEQGFNVFRGNVYHYEMMLRYWIICTYVISKDIKTTEKCFKEYHSLIKFMYHHF